jgi:hypothetical protein
MGGDGESCRNIERERREMERTWSNKDVEEISKGVERKSNSEEIERAERKERLGVERELLSLEGMVYTKREKREDYQRDCVLCIG